jgi:hypothetical protein
MKYFVIPLLLTGCATNIPVVMKFPEAPTVLMEKCPQLKFVEQDPKLSDVAKTVAINYTTYYECALKVESWIGWYQAQKVIFESVK